MVQRRHTVRPTRTRDTAAWRLTAGILAVTVTLAACGASDESGAGAESTESVAETLRRVRVAPVTPADGMSQLAFSGVTRAAERGELTFQVAGTLSSRAAIGDDFAAGDALAELYNPQFGPAVDAARQQLAEARAAAEQAERDLVRVRDLQAEGAATTEELEQVRSAAERARAARSAAAARLAEARRLADETRLIAPFAGTVTQVFAERGEFVSPGQPVLAVSGSGRLEVEIALPESLILARSVGEPVTVRLPFVDQTTTGRVAEIARAAPGAGRLFPVVVSINADGLRGGLTAEVLITPERPDALTVPVRAVVDPGSGEPRVFLLDDDTARRVPVTVGDIIGERVIVTGNLAGGDTVIVSGLARLIDGQRVAVAE